jgi:serine/threonine protein kinase
MPTKAGRLKIPLSERLKPWQGSALTKGTEVRGLRIERFLGRGSFGAVYRVRRRVDGLAYALKIVDIGTRSQRGREAAVNEVRVLASVQSEYVLRFWEGFVHQDRLHIVTDYAPGSDLAKRLLQLQQSHEKLPERHVWSYFIQLCRGLQALHGAHILHRDLKPANCLLVTPERLKIADLGIAKVTKADDPVAQTQCGTPAYFSPELWRNRAYGDKSDVWALGCILYEMVTNRLPFSKAKHVLWGHYPPPVHAGEAVASVLVRGHLSSYPAQSDGLAFLHSTGCLLRLCCRTSVDDDAAGRHLRGAQCGAPFCLRAAHAGRRACSRAHAAAANHIGRRRRGRQRLR